MLLEKFIEGSTQCNCEIGLFPQGVADTPHAKTDGFFYGVVHTPYDWKGLMMKRSNFLRT